MLPDVEQVPHGRTARRLAWAHLPPEVRRYVEGRLGSPVVDAESQGAGFTPGFASRLTGADGSRLFVKAANKVAQKPFAEAYAEEARKLGALPEGLPLPRLLWEHQDSAWVVLGFECVEGRNPHRPWRLAELERCLAALTEVAEATETFSPTLGLKPLHEDLPGLVTGWDHVRRTQPDWPHLAEATDLARSFATVPDGDRLVHSDARDDNFLLTKDGRALICDWNWPALGPVWVDVVGLLISAYGDGLDADALLAAHPLTAAAEPDHLDAFLSALTGFMLEAGDRPVPATSPYLRVHARWYAEAGWAWLAGRRGWA